MARISFRLYSIVSGAPLAGATVDVLPMSRINADDSITGLTGPDVEDDGAGFYHALVDDSLLPAGSEINYIVRYVQDDASGNPITMYLDGSLESGASSSSTPFPVVALDDTQDVVLRVGDRAPSFTDTLRDAAGNPVAIGGGDTVTFSMRSDQGGSLVIDHDAVTVVDGPSGSVLYAWADGATDEAGNYLAEMQLTTGGLISTFPYARQLVVRVIPTV